MEKKILADEKPDNADKTKLLDLLLAFFSFMELDVFRIVAPDWLVQFK